MRGILLVLIFLVSLFECPAQKIFSSHFSTMDGLNNVNINVLDQDEKGLLWIGTTEGLFTFDGKSFKEVSYSIENSEKYVNDLLIDSENNLWISSKGGITSYDGSSFKHYKLGDPFLKGNYNHLFEWEDGVIGFFLNDHIFFKIDDEEIQETDLFPPDENVKIKDLYQVNKDSIWLLTEDDQLFGIFNHRTAGPFGKELKDYENPNFIISESGSIMIGTNSGILKFHTDNLLTNKNPYSRGKFYPNNIFIDSRGNNWLNYRNEIFLVTDMDSLRTDINLNMDEKPVFLEDYEGNMWIGLSGTGLFRIAGFSLWQLYNPGEREYMPSHFKKIKEELWISYFGSGIRIRKRREIDSITMVDGLISNYVRKLVEKDDDIWAITARGISKISGSHIYSYTTDDGLPNNYCFDAIVDQRGRLVIGTEGGLAIQQDERFRIVSKKDGLSNNRIKHLLPQSDGSILLMSDDVIEVYSEDSISVLVKEQLKPKEVLNPKPWN